MRSLFTLVFFFLITQIIQSQDSRYTISFENAVHHEGEVRASFHNLESRDVSLRMSRTSPGRYALHEFAKNVYNLTVTDGNGNLLEVTRPDPYQWVVTGHNGTIHVSYTIYANHADGTYAQIDETHAHLNIPATFIFVPELRYRPVKVNFKAREDLNWKVATQLKLMKDGSFYAPNLDYFMDSPTELSDHSVRSFKVNSGGKEYEIRFVLHHEGTETEFDTYFEKVKAIVKEQKAVFGELPEFDYGTYTFLACYLPHVAGDGMEHRNSTVLTNTRSLAKGGMEQNIGTVSHEFFHAWNVERIRPKSLEPFDYQAADMSGALWFAEGFTSYYTSLILCRAGLITPEQYIEGLSGTFNYVWNSPARKYFNPIQKSYQAPFVDAARSVDDVNRENTFISYYSYGSMLGLALDLELRNLNEKYSLDGYMQKVWQAYGKTEIPYTLSDLQKTLNTYTTSDFGDYFFDNYIYKSNMPDFSKLFTSMGVMLKKKSQNAYTGMVTRLSNGKVIVSRNVKANTPAYRAGLEKGDAILAINEKPVLDTNSLREITEGFVPGNTITIDFERFGKLRRATLLLEKDPTYQIQLFEKEDKALSDSNLRRRKAWLSPKS
ncbi:M61 family metallopeptidase [Ascidiimonas aurantiaca]|uniref:M61 family metallopeptidase n=1 Tax=Ascidiimonas aurantiaca TaxID=1685432 RepID=UPI0030EB7515